MIRAETPLNAWREASAFLIANGRSAYNLLVEFPSAPIDDERELVDYDPRRVLGSAYDCARDVANTIFPNRTYANSRSRAEFYERYLRAHSRRPKKGWGSYFERLISFGGKRVNQLEHVITALSEWKGSYRAAMIMHLSSAETDNLRPLGAPCLQYVQLNCPNRTQIDMLAVYRNHDFSNKVLGNYYGLNRLLGFICGEAGRTPGTITCLSAHAYCEASSTNQRTLARIS